MKRYRSVSRRRIHETILCRINVGLQNLRTINPSDYRPVFGDLKTLSSVLVRCLNWSPSLECAVPSTRYQILSGSPCKRPEYKGLSSHIPDEELDANEP